jgi:hypothetical protein
MRLFLRRVGFFVLILLLSAMVLQAIITFRTSKLFVHKKGILEQTEGINADLVLLGSSRCWMQLDASFFDSSFHLNTANLGANGHGELSMAVVRLKQYLLTNKAPSYAILSFDPLCKPGARVADSSNLVNKDKFAVYAFLPIKRNLPIVDYFGFRWWERYLPLYTAFKYNLTSDFFTKKDLTKQMERGYDIYQEKWDTLITPVVHGKYSLTGKHMEDLLDALRQLKELCDSNHIMLFCLQTPVYETLYDSAAFSTTSDICKRLQIPFADVNKRYIISNTNYFYNSNHLNKEGLALMNHCLQEDSVLVSFLAGKHE